MINQQSSQPGIETFEPAHTLAPFVIRPQQSADIEAIVAFSLRAWQPVHESMASVLGPRLNRLVYPDWAAGQARAVEARAWSVRNVQEEGPTSVLSILILNLPSREMQYA